MIKKFLKAQITQHIPPIRRIVEENHRLNSVARYLESELEANRFEVMRLKRQFNVIGDPYKLFGSYAEALAECGTPKGYDSSSLSRYLVDKSVIYLKQLPVSGAIHIGEHTALSFLVALFVAKSRGSLNVIDFGGGVPPALLSHLLGDHFSAQWHIVEIPTLVEAAQGELNVPNVTFSSQLDVSVNQLGKVDLVHASGVLQYVDDPRSWLERLLAIRAEFVFFNRCGFTEGEFDVIGIQRSPISDLGPRVALPLEPDGFMEIPFYYMRKREFDEIMVRANYKLIATFDSKSGFRPINDEPISGGAFLYRLR